MGAFALPVKRRTFRSNRRNRNAKQPRTNPKTSTRTSARHSSTRGRASTTLHTHNGVCLRWYGVGGEPLGSSGERRARAPAGTSPDGTSRTAPSLARREHRARRFPSMSRAGARGHRGRRPRWNVRRSGVRGYATLVPSRRASKRGSGLARHPAASVRARPQRVPFTGHVLESPLTLYPLLFLGRFARPFARRSR